MAPKSKSLIGMNPPKFIIFAIAFGIAVTPTEPSLASDRPNILFILADDLGWADTTLYGHTNFYETPQLERLAERGMLLTRHYTSSPLCSPTRSAVITGQHPARTGFTTPGGHTPKVVLQAVAAKTGKADQKLAFLQPVTRLDTKYETISRRLKSEGYRTAHFGKWHLGSEPYSPLEHGFDLDIPHHPGPGPAGSYVAPWKFKHIKEAYPSEHIEDRMGDEIAAYLEEHQKAPNKPFFINYWQFSVHGPFNAKESYVEEFRSKVDPDNPQRSPTYAAMVKSLDDNIGKVLDTLDRLDLAKNTVIIFSSDNGGNMYNEVDGTYPTSNAPLRGGKGANWDGGVRVPGIAVWPGEIEAGSTSDEFVTSTDFYPTLLDMLSLKPSADQTFDGDSVLPIFKGDTIGDRSIFTFFPHSTGVPDTLPPSAAIYRGNWKLFRFFHDGPKGEHRHELYDLNNDIGETNDIASTHPERVEQMAASLDNFLTNTNALIPNYNPAYQPSSAKLETLGFIAGKNAVLSLENNQLIVEALDTKVNFELKTTAEPGDLTLAVHFTSTAPGRIDLRWAEEDVTPVYFKNRLVRSRNYPKSRKSTLILPFTAGATVTSFRIDFMQPAGTIQVEKIELQRHGTTEQSWTFEN
ncbi:MAG: N-acetylgalactosamine 6-sulfate sulfatase [Verrucomicrobiales bacterium]|nr:N-acetylgalactosamine 6-sulfate sulfatase [Verrucomicrobiales bacterium]